MNKYRVFHKHLSATVDAESEGHAKQLAAQMFKAKNQDKIIVYMIPPPPPPPKAHHGR